MRVYLDIETAPSEDFPEDHWVGEIKVGNRGPEKAAEFRKAKADEAWRKTSLDTVFARILCVGVAVDNTTPVCILEDTEERTLRVFAGRLLAADKRAEGKRETLTFVAHNGLSFDLPLLVRRMLKYAKADDDNLNKASALLWCSRRYGDHMHVDTMNAWVGSGDRYQTKSSLDAICMHLGISREDNPCSGAEIFERWQDAEVDAIRAHVLADVRALREVHYRLRAAGMCA